MLMLASGVDLGKTATKKYRRQKNSPYYYVSLTLMSLGEDIAYSILAAIAWSFLLVYGLRMTPNRQRRRSNAWGVTPLFGLALSGPTSKPDRSKYISVCLFFVLVKYVSIFCIHQCPFGFFHSSFHSSF